MNWPALTFCLLAAAIPSITLLFAIVIKPARGMTTPLAYTRRV